jgi:voltage-dependent potassium channel beta subunit
MGECIKRGIDAKEWTREDLVISTKIYFGVRDGPNYKGLSRKHIVEGTTASLARLQLSYVDILFCHRPDPITPIEETVRAMNHIIDKGQAFYWGTSMWSAVQIEEAIAVCDRLGLIRPVAEQPEYNLFARGKLESEYLPLFRNYGLGTTVWSPLASGVLTGKYKGGVIPEGARLGIPAYGFLKDAKMGSDSYQLEKAEVLRPIAEKLGCTLAQMAIAWTLKNDNCTTTILGATRLSQLEENLQALEVIHKLTPEVLAEIEAVVQNKPAPTSVEVQVANLRKSATIHGLYR